MSNNVIDLDAGRVLPYMMQAIEGFLRDPPDTDFQRGYLSALCMVMREGLRRGQNDARLEAAERLTQQPVT